MTNSINIETLKHPIKRVLKTILSCTSTPIHQWVGRIYCLQCPNCIIALDLWRKK